MADNINNQSDNPMFDIFNRVLGQDEGRKKVGQQVDNLLRYTEASPRKGQGVTNLLQNLDPRGVSGFGTGNYEIFRSSSDLDFMRSRFSSDVSFNQFKKFVDKTLQSGGSENAFLFYNRDKNALFASRATDYLNPFSKDQIIPVPVYSGRSSRVVNIGYNTFGLYDYPNVGSRSYRDPLEALYSADIFGRPDSIKTLTDFTNVQIGPNARLRDFLESAEPIRGQSRVSKVAQKSTLINYTNPGKRYPQLARLEQLAARRQSASAAINIITRKGFFKDLADSYDFLQGATTATEAFGRAVNITQNYSDELVDQLGPDFALQYPYIKPEFLLGEKALKIGSREIQDIFPTGFYSKRIYEKGLYQMFNIGFQGDAQEAALGRRAYAPYYMQGQYKAYQAGNRDLIRRGRPYKVAVLDFDNELTSALWTTDSGALLTNLGATREARFLPSGSMNIPLTTPETADLVDDLFGNVGSKIGFTKKQVDIAFSLSGEYNKLEKLLSKSNPSEKDIEKIRKIERRIATKEAKVGNQNLVKFFRNKSSKKAYGMIRTAARYGYSISDYSLKSGNAVVQFRTSAAATPGASEIVLGSVRQTAIRPARETLKARFLSNLERAGVDIAISSSDFKKMYAADVMMTNMFSILEENNLVPSTVEEINRRAGRSVLSLKSIKTSTGNEIHVPVVHNFTDAVNASKAVLSDWGKTKEKRKLVQEILYGKDGASRVILPTGIRGVRMFNIMGGFRSDFMEDINAAKSIRLTPSKILTMARNTRALGLSPKDNPFLNMLLKTQKSRGLNLSLDTLTYSLDPSSTIRQASETLLGINPKISSSNMLTVRGNNFRLGNRTVKPLNVALREFYGDDIFKNISSLEQLFSFKQGGISFDALKGTLLDRDLMSDFAFLDPSLTKSGRALPIPLKIAGLDKGIENNLVVNRKLGRDAISNIFLLEQAMLKGKFPIGDFEEDQFVESTKFGLKGLMRGAKGKRGGLEKKFTLIDKLGTRARLIPQAGDYSANMLASMDEVFTMRVDKMELEDVLSRKMGQVNQKSLEAIKTSLKDKGYTYIMASVDPTQRGEHQQIIKLMYQKGSRATTQTGVDKTLKQIGIGQLNVSANPIWFRMTERDTDRDVLNIHFLEGYKELRSNLSQKRLEKMYKAQVEASRSFASWYKYELASQKYESLASPSVMRSFYEPLMSATGLDKVKKHLKSYLSQKSEAHFGYTITRAVDRFMDILDSDSSGLAINKKGAALLEEVKGATNIVERGIAQNLSQTLFQGGVAKGQTSALDELSKGLIGIRERVAKSKTLVTRQEIIDEASPLFEKFLRSQYSMDSAGKITGKRREFMAMDYILKQEGYSDHAINLLRQDLERETVESLDRVSLGRVQKASETLIKGTSRILAGFVGVGYGLQSLIRAPANLISIMQDQGTYISEDNMTKKLLEPLASTSGTGSGLSEMTEAQLQEAAEKKIAAKKTTLDKFSASLEKLTQALSKKGTLYGVLGGAVAGVVGYSMLDAPEPPSSPLPPPMNRNVLSDQGPIIPSSAALYGNNTVQPMPDPFMSSSANSIGIGTNPYRPTSFQNIMVQDKVSPINPGLIAKQMGMVANSDFNY